MEPRQNKPNASIADGNTATDNSVRDNVPRGNWDEPIWNDTVWHAGYEIEEDRQIEKDNQRNNFRTGVLKLKLIPRKDFP